MSEDWREQMRQAIERFAATDPSIQKHQAILERRRKCSDGQHEEEAHISGERTLVTEAGTQEVSMYVCKHCRCLYVGKYEA